MLIDEEFLLRTNIERCLIVIQRLFPPETHSDDDDVALLWDTIHELKKKITKVERYEAAKVPEQPDDCPNCNNGYSEGGDLCETCDGRCNVRNAKKRFTLESALDYLRAHNDGVYKITASPNCDALVSWLLDHLQRPLARESVSRDELVRLMADTESMTSHDLLEALETHGYEIRMRGSDE